MKTRQMILIAIAAFFCVPITANPAYTIDDIQLPKGVAPEIGGLAFTSTGELVVVTRRSGILIGKPSEDAAAFEWRVFSDQSLHNPMGILIESDSSFLVPTMQQLTRIADTDGDGVADLYEAVSTDWGVSGNYHETNGGPVPDGDGWLVAIGTASHNGPTFKYVRGEYSEAGRRGRNFAAVKWKGWVVKVHPDGRVSPYASGFRANNGIARGPKGSLWVTDNQGDWRGTSPLFAVEKHGFYGHPNSLVWDESFNQSGDPLQFAIDNMDQFDDFRDKAAVELPHGLIASSPAEPIMDATGGKFGPFAGQLYVADVAGARVVRAYVEQVQGVWQGMATHLYNGSGLRGGGNRLTFSPDGKSLYVGQTFRGWGGPAEGLQRITYKGTPSFDVKEMSLTNNGFKLTFTTPVDKATAGNADHYQLKHYYYPYGHKYGGSPQEVTEAPVQSVQVAEDGMSVMLTLGNMVPLRIYEMRVEGLKGADGADPVGKVYCYTIKQLR